MRKWGWKALVGVSISALLIWWVLRDVDPLLVWAEVARANWWLLLAAVAVATSGFLVRALRWKVFLDPIHPRTSLHSRFAAVNIGFGLNNLLPARVGELARAWSMSRLEPVSASAAVGSIVVERVLDAVAVFGLAAVAVLHPSFPLDEVRGLGALLPTASAVMAVGLVALILLLVFPGAIVGYARRLVPLLPGRSGHLLVEVLEAFLTGFRSLRSPRLFAAGILWSFAFWGWNAVSFLLAFRAFGIQEGYGAALFVQAVIALGVAIPAAPGYFGTFHAAAVVALHEVYGVAEGATLAFAFGYHLGGFVPVTLLGLWYAWRLGLTLVELRRAEEVVEAELEGSPGSATTTGAGTARDDAPSRPSRPDRT